VGAARVIRRVNAATVEDEDDQGHDCVFMFMIRSPSFLGC